MNLSLKKLSAYGFNHRPLVEDDLLQICAQENITVFYKDVPTSFYLEFHDRHFIVLRKHSCGLRRTFALAHELAHYFLHGGNLLEQDYLFEMLSAQPNNKNEIEADTLALIALIPKSALGCDEFLKTHTTSYARDLYIERQRLYFLYGI